ncbi:hypothetical protein [Jatrophihabitans fulvus]
MRRLAGLTTAFLWSVEMLPSGFSDLRTITSPVHVLGGESPAPGTWWNAIVARAEPEDVPALEAFHRRILSGRPGEVTVRLHGADGVVRSIRTRCRVRSDGVRRHLDGVSEIVAQPGVSR